MNINASKLKQLEEKTPNFIKKMFVPLIRNKVLKNKYFVEQYGKINAFEKGSKHEKERIHFALVKGKLIQAYENTEFYKKLFNEIYFNPYEFKHIDELKKIPPINKEIVLDNFDTFKSKNATNYYTAYTGGSTGKPMKILLDGSIPYKERAFVYKFWEKKLGYSYSEHKIVTFRGLEFGNRLYKNNPIDNQIILSPFKLNADNLEKYIKIIDEFKPKYIHGYPSAIVHFCNLMIKMNKRITTPINGVFLVSENLDEQDKLIIENTLYCKTAIFYGHSERLGFGEYFENKGYMFHPLYGHVELIHHEGSFYKIMITGLLNDSMPLINYIPDDLVEVTPEGNYMIHGHHEKEVLLGYKNEKVSMAAINFHSSIFSKIQRYQFEQFEIGKVHFKMEMEKGVSLTEDDMTLIEQSLNKKLKGILDYEVKIVNEIPLTKRGKFNKIIQHIKIAEDNK